MRSIFAVKSSFLVALGWVVVPLLLIGWSADLTFESQNALIDSQGAVTHAIDVRQRARSVYISLVDAETGQRGYLLTSREAYLEPYNRALQRLPHLVESLQAMTADDPVQVGHMTELHALMAAKLAEMSATIRLARSGDMPAALRIVGSEQGRLTMDKIRIQIRQIRIICDHALAAKQDAFTSEAQSDTRMALLLVAVSGLFAAVVVLLIWRLMRMESLVTICAWSQAIEYQGEWMSFEDYLKRRFGLETTHGISPAEQEKFRKALDRASNTVEGR